MTRPCSATVTPVLRVLGGPASLAAFATDAGPSLGFSGLSLLACFAVLALQDLVGGQEIRQCDNCGALFPNQGP